MKQTFILFRNMSAFIYAWLVILIVIIGTVTRVESIALATLMDVLVFSLLIAVVFSVLFSKAFLRKLSLLWKINLMMVSSVCLELVLFYRIGLFQGVGTVAQWLIFFGIVEGLYLICLLIFKLCQAKKDKQYTLLLEQYKNNRRNEMHNNHGENQLENDN